MASDEYGILGFALVATYGMTLVGPIDWGGELGSNERGFYKDWNVVLVMELKGVKKFLENLDQDNVVFDSHFYRRCGERPIDEGMVRSFLSKVDKLEKIEEGNNGRFKLWFRMSGKYSLVLIVEIFISKGLKVVSAWNSDRKWQKKLKR